MDQASVLGTVVICTALEEEYVAVQEHLDKPFEEFEERGTLYEVAELPADGGTWSVVLVQTGAGNEAASAQLERAITCFEPEIVLFVGVAGGVKDVRLGDVVAAEHVYGYETGKDTAEGFRSRGKSDKAAHRLVQRALQIARERSWQHRILPEQPGDLPGALVKPIASGSKVVADQKAATTALIREHFSDAVAVEMEGHGFHHAAYMNHTVEALMVRGISDLLSDKTEVADRKWQPTASRHAAAFAFELLSRLRPRGSGPGTAERNRARASDLAAVKNVTEENLLVLNEHATLPGVADRFAVDRAESPVLLAAEGSYVLTGEPGCGKSGALYRLARDLIGRGEDIVLLTVDTLGAQPGTIRDDVQLSQSLLALLRDWPGDSRATLLVDGLDASRTSPLTWLVSLVRGLARSRWRVIATMRRFDLRHSHIWTEVFAGSPVSGQVEHVDDTLLGVRHFVLGSFSADELTTLSEQQPEVAQLVSGANEHLKDLVRNPFNLRLACELLESGVSQASLAAARDQLELLQKYWAVRVTRHTDSPARLRVLELLSATMLEKRVLRASGACIPDGLLNARTGLVQDGVVNEIPSRLKAGGSPSMAYSHHILFDYSVAALILAGDDDSQLVPRLRKDPNLVLVARPSIDLHLADLWHLDNDRSTFAAVVAAIARHGDSLAGVAAVRTFVSEADVSADVQWLVGLSASDLTTFSTVTGWIAGVLDTKDEAVRWRNRDKIELWAEVLAVGAAQVQKTFDRTLVNQINRLLIGLDTLQSMKPQAPAAVVWANCVAAFMRVALDAPAEREPLGSSVARFLPQAIAIDSAHGSVLRQTLQPAITALWPPQYLFRYVDAVEVIAGADPDLACDLLSMVLRSDEDSQDAIPLFQGIVSMTTTPKQELEAAKYAVGQVMRGFIRVAGIARAVDVLEAALPCDADAPGYPITYRTSEGQIDLNGRTLKYGPGHGVAETIVSVFADALPNLDLPAVELDALVEGLVARIRHPEAWRSLLSAAAEKPTGLGHAFLLALRSGGLLAHSGTRAAAGMLIRAVGSALSTAQQLELEQAILAAPIHLVNASAERTERLLDQLAGCLDVEKIQDASLLKRVLQQEKAGGAPSIPQPQHPTAIVEPLTLNEYLEDQGTALTEPQQREALDNLRQIVDALPPNLEAEHVSALELALRQALAAGVGGPEHNEPGAELVFRAIEHLVRAASLAPESDLAALIMPLLLAAARQSGSQEKGGAQQ